MSPRWSSAARPRSPGSGTSTTPTSAGRCASPARNRPPPAAAAATPGPRADDAGAAPHRPQRHGADRGFLNPPTPPARHRARAVAGDAGAGTRRHARRRPESSACSATGISRPQQCQTATASPQPKPRRPRQGRLRRRARRNTVGVALALTDGRSRPQRLSAEKASGQRNPRIARLTAAWYHHAACSDRAMERRPWRRRTERSSSSPATPIPQLAEAIAAYLKIPLTKAVVRRFADMEIFVEIQENVRGADVFVHPVDVVPGQRPPDGAADHHRRAAPLLGAPHHRGDALFRLRPAGPQTRPAHADLGQARRQPDHPRRRRPRA